MVQFVFKFWLGGGGFGGFVFPSCHYWQFQFFSLVRSFLYCINSFYQNISKFGSSIAGTLYFERAKFKVGGLVVQFVFKFWLGGGVRRLRFSELFLLAISSFFLSTVIPLLY